MEATTFAPQERPGWTAPKPDDLNTLGNGERLPWSEGEIKEMFGFKPDDPRVAVTMIPLTRAGSDPFGGLDVERLLRDIAADTVTAPVTDDPRAETPAEKLDRLRPAINAALMEVLDEVAAAVAKHAPMNSPHEGYSVILEELDELWDHVKGDTGRTGQARKEAKQVAATAIRYMVDLDPRG